MIRRLCLFLVFFVVLAGCEEYTYEITMSPAGDKVVRRVVCSDNMPQDVLDKLAKLYPQRIDARTFEGKFIGELPKDVGGAGTYHCFMTNMGSLSVYSERFRGDDDLDGKLARMRDWADKFTDLIIGWLESELGDDNNFGKLRKFCDENLRKDIKNLSLLVWMGGIVSKHYKDESEGEFFARGAQYLYERGYFDVADLTAMVINEEGEGLLHLIRKLITEKMGYDDQSEISGLLGFLAGAEQTEESLEKYIVTTDLYKEIWEIKKEKDPNTKAPDLEEVMLDLTSKSISGDEWGLNLFGPTNAFYVKFTCPHKPIDTNGKWDEEKKLLSWSTDDIPRDSNKGYPVLYYAFWGSADEEFQKKHFGKIVLEGEGLAQYCMWHKNLSVKHKLQWDNFLLSLQADENLTSKLTAFVFPDSQGKQKKTDPSLSIRQMLIRNVSEKKDEGTEK